jgi:hypothetical protein
MAPASLGQPHQPLRSIALAPETPRGPKGIRRWSGIWNPLTMSARRVAATFGIDFEFQGVFLRANPLYF